MFRRYLQQALLYGKKQIGMSQVAVLESGQSFIPKRGAGHSKWQNIKSTKEAADSNKSQNFQRIARQIVLAVKKGGEDVSGNSKLRSLMEEAQRVNMPKATIQKAILAAKSQQVDQPYWVVFTGPRGVALGLEVTFANKNPGFLNTKIAPQTKKLNLKMEVHFQDICTEKGVIIAKGSSEESTSYDKAVEDAIQVGADDVFEGEDKAFIFECLAERLEGVCSQLMKLGYDINSSSVELDFKDRVNLSEEERRDIETIVSKLQGQHEEIIRAAYNYAG